MSNTRKLTLKNIICSIILCLCVVLSAFVTINYSKQEHKVSAAVNDNIIQDVSKDLLNSYHNFYTTSSSKPASVSGWSEISDPVDNKANIIKGIVDLENENTFNTTTYKTTKPNMPKSQSTVQGYFKNLMINSHNGAGRLGYKSPSINLEKDSFYSISVKLYTHRTSKTDKVEECDPTASIYLTGLTEDEDYSQKVKFENINTLTGWVDYTFYIDTDTSATINLELWLGSKTSSIQGAVFFNNVKILRYSEDYYRENIATEEKRLEDQEDLSNTFNLIELSKKADTQFINNGSFENTTPFEWKKLNQSSNSQINNNLVCDIVNTSTYAPTIDKTTIEAPGSNCSENNSLALFMYNEKDGYQGIESSEFTIEKLAYYRVNFWAKSNCNIGKGATVYLVDKTEENPIDNASLTLATTYTSGKNKFRNDWTKYSFYIYGDDLEEKNLTIQIWLGTKETQTKGYVFIDDFTIENIDYSTFSSNSSASNSTSMNFNADADSFVITNSTFNKTQNKTNEKTYPLTPADWTHSGNDNNTTFSGVINTSEDEFNNHIDDYSTLALIPERPTPLPYTSNENNNVLMIGSSAENNSQTYSSKDLSLSADSYYKLSFYVYTDYRKNNLKSNSGARVSITSSTKTLFDCFNIYYDDSQWHKYEIYIKTGINSETAIINLKFADLTGYVYFDELMLETSSEDSFNNHYKYPEVKYFDIDLSYENFDNRTFNKIGDIQEPYNWTGAEQDGLSINTAGILNKDNYRISDYQNSPSNNENVLYLSSLHDVYYTFTSKENYTFEAQSYYKISVNILTDNLIAEKTPEEDSQNYGASFGLAKSTEIFLKGIRTENQNWKTCTLYICLDEELVSPIALSLGAKDEKISGKVLFDNLKIEKIDKETYQNEILTADRNYTEQFINYSEPTEEETEDSEWTNDFNWVIIPSLLTGLAIIIAVVGFYVRKLTFNRKPKIKTKYDRRKTLDKDIDRKEKIALRQQIIDELNAELQQIDKQIEEYEKTAQEQLEIMKKKIVEEKEEIKRQQIEIEIRKKEATAEREKELKKNPELVANKKAEKDFESFITRLDKQEMKLQKQMTQKDVKLALTQETDKTKLAKYLERKEFIKNEIAKIEAEIEEIAKEEAKMWEEYKLAKQEAKIRKAEYKAQVKAEKELKKSQNKKDTDNNSSKKEELKVEDNQTTHSNKNNKKEDNQQEKTVNKETKKSPAKKTTEIKKTTTKNTSSKTTTKKSETTKKASTKKSDK